MTVIPVYRRKRFFAPRSRQLFFIILLASFAALASAQAQLGPVFRNGAEPIFVPSEMPPVSRFWHPTNKLKEPGIKSGPEFKASLVRVFNEDTPFSSEIAVFRMPDGSVRAWKSRSFSPEDLSEIRKLKAKSPAVLYSDTRTWITELPPDMRDALAKKQINIAETTHFVFIWGQDRNGSGKILFEQPDFVKKAGEWFEKVWNFYAVDCRAPMPHDGEPKPKRIVVRFYGTGIPGLHESWADAAELLSIHPDGTRYGSTVVPHEFGHVVEFYTGGFRDSPSVGAWWETHAEFGAFIFSPSYPANMDLFLKKMDKGCQWTESRYGNWPILMHLWEKQRTQGLVFGIWPKNRRGPQGQTLEDQLETLVRLGQANGSLPKGWESFNEEVGEMAARLVTMDYINQGYLADATADWRKDQLKAVITPDPKSSGWFNSPESPLYAYGCQWLELKPQSATGTVEVSFRGTSKSADAQWRLTLVAVDQNNVARYSPRITASGASEARLRMAMKPGETCILAVAATPRKYTGLKWDEVPANSYPFQIRVTGAEWRTAAQTGKDQAASAR